MIAVIFEGATAPPAPAIPTPLLSHCEHNISTLLQTASPFNGLMLQYGVKSHIAMQLR